MIEKHIILEDIDPVMFYGVGNGNLQMIKSLYPKLRIVARDNVIRVLGDEEEMAKAEEDIELMRKHLAKYNMLNEEDILDIVKGKQTKADSVKGVLVYSISGRPIKSRSENQQQLIEAYEKNDMIFAVGPAGTGKTYLSIALAVKALKEKAIKKIILSRPAVEAGEKLGFLPGDMKDKIDPYLQPLYDALEEWLKNQNIVCANACIAYPDQEPDKYLTKDSVAFHTHLGYQMVGEFHRCAYKFGRWYNMVWMEKSLCDRPEHPEPMIWFSKLRKKAAKRQELQ